VAIDREQALDDAEDYWLGWARSGERVCDYHDEVHRSLLVLKALTYAPTGGVVAAPTIPLPKRLGVSATATTASAGSAIRPSCCLRCSKPVIETRPRFGKAGS
jgi:hypothetical protein